MKKIAINVVLLPSREITQEAIEINEKLGTSEIKLNNENCLPHITLAMGVIDEKDLEKVEEVLNGVSFDFNVLNLSFNKVESEETPSGKIVSGIPIKKSKQLQELHEEIMEKLESYLTYDVDKSMLYNPDEVEEETLSWIKDYKQTSFKKFKPHITLGIGKVNSIQPMAFRASTLALFQLGNYCTCRKLLFETELTL